MKTAEEILKEHTDVDNGVVSSYDYVILQAMKAYSLTCQEASLDEVAKRWHARSHSDNMFKTIDEIIGEVKNQIKSQ